MSYLAAIQMVTETGSVAPLPGERDVIEVTAGDAFDLGHEIAKVVTLYPGVYDFDLTITNQANDPTEEGHS